MSMRKVATVEDTYWDRVDTLAKELGILFLGFLPRHKDKSKTKCKLFCERHQHYWETTTICNFLVRKTNPCKHCSMEAKVFKLTIPEKEYKRQVKEACSRYNTEFLHWTGDYRGVQSIITHKCKIHEVVTQNTAARSLVENRNQTSGCTCCQKELFFN